ncbi:MAG TPA: type II secretion system protein [Fimbriimonadaceae bacterium]|nr:type II secretion system protein [Fimbriimonadaceae bacterium]HRJ33447.1 type II secretion system protein [Fimbriimonadaceae bacterium]
MKTKGYPKQKGVTLIEVLVAIAVVMILLGTYWVAIRPSMMRKAYDTEAIAGLRGWFNAYQMYRADHEDKEPVIMYQLYSYNPKADWNVPVAKRNAECGASGYFYGRHGGVQKYAESVEFLNKYYPATESIFEAHHRCHRFPGRTTYRIPDFSSGGSIETFTNNVKVPIIVEAGRVFWQLRITPFEEELAMIAMSPVSLRHGSTVSE